MTGEWRGMAAISAARLENIERCRALLESGLTSMKVATELGLSLSAINRYRKVLGIIGKQSKPATKKRKRVREPHWTENARTIERDTADLNYYTTEATEFLRAIEAFRSKHRRIPTLVEGFRIAVNDLGYRKDATQ